MNSSFLVKGGIPLSGEVTVSGYKNSAGALLAGVLLSEETSVINNLPLVSDVLNQIKVLEQMGAEIEWLDKRKIKINPKNLDPNKIPPGLFEKMRISVLLIGPLLTRFKKFQVPHPGGDRIGLRPITTHLEAFKHFGIDVKLKDGFYIFEKKRDEVDKHIILEEFSVTATENIMMLAAVSKGKTKVDIAAAEPQVQDLGHMLNLMGADIQGLGGHTLEIQGKDKLSGIEFSVCSDPIEVGTLLIAFAITGGQGKIKKANLQDLTFFLKKMKDIGIKFETIKNPRDLPSGSYGADEIIVKPSKDFQATKIQVLPYPGFPTDLQPQTSVLLTQAKGKSVIHEPLYESRFNHLHELRKMGADTEITDPHRALVFGKTELIAAKLRSSDIRAGAALILAALAAGGRSIIENIDQIDRGYERLDEKLKSLGAQIERT